jgi:hypothetical protein
MPGITFLVKYSGQFFSLIGMLKTFQNIRFEKLIAKIYAEWQNNAKLNKGPSKFSPSLGENDGKFISTWNFGITYLFSSLWR